MFKLPRVRPFNPSRRNRNIGTSKSGRGQNNRMSVPELAHGAHAFYERIGSAREVTRVVSGITIRFFVQSTRAECVYPCTVDDISHLLSFVPTDDWEGMQAIVLRQPSRKQETLTPVWGRLSYSAELVNNRGKTIYTGPAITLEAMTPGKPLKWGKSLSPDQSHELNRLISDGHNLQHGDKRHTLEMSLESCRATQLYRTIPHELGHWVDFLEKVERPSAADDTSDYSAMVERYHSRSTREKEHFAHAYAARLGTQLRTAGAIPFERKLEPEQLLKDGLAMHDFVLTDGVVYRSISDTPAPS